MPVKARFTAMLAIVPGQSLSAIPIRRRQRPFDIPQKQAIRRGDLATFSILRGHRARSADRLSGGL
jgi:hypothetical protein